MCLNKAALLWMKSCLLVVYESDSHNGSRCNTEHRVSFSCCLKSREHHHVYHISTSDLGPCFEWQVTSSSCLRWWGTPVLMAEPVTQPCEALRTSTFAGVTWLSLHLRWRRSVFLSPHSLHWLTTLKIKNTNFHIFALLMFLGFFWWGKQITMNQLIHSIDLMNDHSSQKDE